MFGILQVVSLNMWYFTGSYVSELECQLSTLILDGLKLSGTEVIKYILGMLECNFFVILLKNTSFRYKCAYNLLPRNTLGT